MLIVAVLLRCWDVHHGFYVHVVRDDVSFCVPASPCMMSCGYRSFPLHNNSEIQYRCSHTIQAKYVQGLLLYGRTSNFDHQSFIDLLDPGRKKMQERRIEYVYVAKKDAQVMLRMDECA